MLSNEVMHFEKGGKAMPNELVSFDIAYKQLMERWEDPHYSGKITTDAGGKTRYGLSESAYPSLDLNTITLSRAQEITHADYWMYNAWDISNLPVEAQPLANKLFQFGFNTGVGTVIQITNLCISLMTGHKILPPLGAHLILAGILPSDAQKLVFMLSSAQLSRYIKDYHFLAKVPHSLLDRALCIE